MMKKWKTIAKVVVAVLTALLGAARWAQQPPPVFGCEDWGTGSLG